MVNDRFVFPEGFLWGTATASHQVEGGNENNDWWAWEQMPGRISDGSRCGLASDWWHRAEEDLSVAAELGQNSHRLSLEWSRLEPNEGAWDEMAVARYRQILGYMRSIGLKPMITIHHFTLPLWLYERGGWENERTEECFVRYARRVVETFGDLCDLWCTVNEPMLYALYSYVYGYWPPGNGGIRVALNVVRHMARAHVQAYQAIHEQQANAMVGYAKHLRIFDPANPMKRRDRALARFLDYLFNEIELVAFASGTLLVPLGWKLSYQKKARFLDFIGLNYYSRDLVEPDLHRSKDFYIRRSTTPGVPFIPGWGEVYPEGLYRALKRLSDWGLPIYVTEFGVSDGDDTLRPRFIVTHVAAMCRALREGVPLQGAYFWTLVDNFEWAAGWSARFGLISLDSATQTRKLRRSAQIYQRIAQTNSLERALVDEFAPGLVTELFDS